MSAMDLAAALHGAPPVHPALAAPPDLPDVPGKPDDTYENSMQALDVAVHALHAFIRMDPDSADKATASKALTLCLGLQGSHDKSVQAGDAKSLSRALAGSSSIGVPGGGY